MAAKNKPNELSLTREYEAPLRAVWDAWTDPEQVARWWGPRGFTLTTHRKDVRTGGSWVYTMHGPDGVDYPNDTKYIEVKEYSKLVYDHGANDDQPPIFRVTVLFSESRGRTRMEMTMACPTPEAAASTKKFIKGANGDTTWDRLAEYLAEQGSSQTKFVINRAFHASPEKLYQMWTDPAHFSRWLPPAGFTMKFLRADVKVGGSTFYSITNGADVTSYGRTEYRELVRPSRIVNVQHFSDEHERVSRHPLSPTWPMSMLTTVTITAEDEEHTRLTIEWEPIDSPTDIELATFVRERAGMTQGWTGSLDKLENLLQE